MPRQSTFLVLLTLITLITYVNSDCRKIFNYHPKYNYGYDIYCNHTSTSELSTTMANNALSLTIVNSNLTIGHATLKYLRKVRQLSIMNAQISFDNQHNDTDKGNQTSLPKSGKSTSIFGSLTNLETLIIKHSNISSSEGISYLNGMENLVTLQLDNDTIENFPRDAFKQLKSLQTLSLKNNRIARIGDLALCNLKDLRHLYLDNNLITALKNDDIQCLDQLEVLSLSGNVLSKLHDIASKSLHVLTVSSNRIDFIEKIDAPNLYALDMSTNKLTNVIANDFKGLSSLLKLDLSYNNLTSVMLLNKFLKHLDLSHNILKDVPKFNLAELRSLNVSYNYIRSINSVDFENVPSLKTFELTNNNLTNIDSNSFATMSNITVLNLSHNLIGNSSLFFVKNSTLSVLNISHNNFDTLPSNLFTNLAKLKHFDVSYNKLKTLDDSTFVALESLETLNMSNNILTQLDYKLLEPLENLIILDVDSNMIQELDYGSIVSELPNLDAFKAKNNLLTCEFLTKMIHYFKDNDIAFSLNEHLDYDKENVEGIYCKETRNKLLDLKNTEEALKNNTKLLNALYDIYSHDDADHSYSISGGEIVMCVLSLISLIVVVTLAVQKAVLWYRRRNYMMDELEMITNEPYKRLG